MTRKQRRAAERTATNAAAKVGPPLDPQPQDHTCNPAKGDICNNLECPICVPYFTYLQSICTSQPTPEQQPPPPPKPSISEAQLAANRRNAQFSTGPSLENRPKTSQNALKHGLTGRLVLLPDEDCEMFDEFVSGYAAKFQPADIVERHHVQNMIDAAWRLERMPILESACLASSRRRLAAADPTLATLHPVEFERLVRIDAEPELRNLRIQEQRLVSRREKETKELRRLQEDRRLVTEFLPLALLLAAQAAIPAKTAPTATAPSPQPPPPVQPQPQPPAPQNGFVFENPENSQNTPEPNLETTQNPPAGPPIPRSPHPEPIPSAA